MLEAVQLRYTVFSFILDTYCLGISKNINRCRQLLKNTMSNTENAVPDTSTDNDVLTNSFNDVNFSRAHSVENLFHSRSWNGESYFHWNWPQSYSQEQYYWHNGTNYSGPDNLVPNPYSGNDSEAVINPVNYFQGLGLPPNFVFNPLLSSQSVDSIQPPVQRHYCMRRNNSDGSVSRRTALSQKIFKVFSKRYWEDVSKKKKSSKPGVEFTLMSYNVLAQDLINEHPYLYKHHNPRSLQWERRWRNLFDEIYKLMPDIMCLQEVQESHLTGFYSRFESLGYEGIYKKRTGIRCDGCAIYYKKDKFHLVENETVEFYQPNVDILNRDNVAVIAKFSPVTSPDTQFVVATTHLLYNPKRQDVRLAQTQLLLTEIERLSFHCKRGDSSCYWPIIITGDFNSTPDSAVYKLITKGVLRYDHLSSRRLDNSKSHSHGNVLVPPSLEITDNCQHARLVQQRQRLDKISREQEESLINLHKSDRSVVKISSECIDNATLFCTGTLSHLFDFKSVYSHGDPDNVEGTTFQDKWLSVDYIFYSGKKHDDKVKDGELKLISRYRLPRRSELGSIKIPNSALGSDHLSLVAKFKLKI